MKALTMTLSLLFGAVFSYSQTPNYNDLWYEHDPLNTTTLDGTNWTLFSSGCGGGQGVDAYVGAIDLPFDFCFYNTNYNHIYLNTKGVLTFLEPMCDWTPSPFPEQSSFNMIAGFWAGFDFTDEGLCHYEVGSNYAVFTFDNVGYFTGEWFMKNSFQMILTDGNSDMLPAGNNVGFFYKDMDWAHSDIGGENGYNGPNPAIVGVDKASGTNHIQFGKFNFNNSNYNSPYEESGVHWLDYKNFIFSTCGTENKPPVSSFNNAALEGEFSSLSDESIQLCIGDTIEIGAQYFGPEQGQVISLEIDNSNAENFTLQYQSDGEVASWSGSFVGTLEFTGSHELVITATDNGSPSASTTQTIVVEVLNSESPQIQITGNPSHCSYATALLSAIPSNLDYYYWTNGCEGTTPNCDVYGSGWVSVYGYSGQCFGQDSIYVETIQGPVVDYWMEYEPHCHEDTLEITVQEGWDTYSWSCYEEDNPNFECNIYTDALDQNTFYCGPGTYTLETTGLSYCNGLMNFYVPDFIGEPLSYHINCGPIEPHIFEGQYSEIEEGYLTIYFQDANGEYANGSWLNVTINGETSQFAMNESSFSISNTEFEITYGDEICIEYIPSPEDDGNNTITIFNCGNGNDALCGSYVGSSDTPIEYALCDTTYIGQTLQWCGEAACDTEALEGEWTQNSFPFNGSFSSTDQYNTVFTPSEYGIYNLTFITEDDDCTFDYILIYTEDVNFEYDGDMLICDTDPPITFEEEFPIGGLFSGNGVSGNTFDPAIAGLGTHQICYTYTNSNCDSIVCIEIEVESCLDINEHSSSPFTIFPNPSSGDFTIQSTLKEGEIQVYDTVGKLVFTETLKSSSVINAKSWKAGIYFLHIHTSDGVFREKIEIIKR